MLSKFPPRVITSEFSFSFLLPPTDQACPAVPALSQKYPELVLEVNRKGGAAAEPLDRESDVGVMVPPEKEAAVTLPVTVRSSPTYKSSPTHASAPTFSVAQLILRFLFLSHSF